MTSWAGGEADVSQRREWECQRGATGWSRRSALWSSSAAFLLGLVCRFARERRT